MASVRARTPYVEFCDQSVTLRLKTTGNRTTKEWATDFLRDNVWGGERITVRYDVQRCMHDAGIVRNRALNRSLRS